MFDITSLETAETSVLHLKSPADDEPLMADGKAVTITFYGPGSDAFIEAEKKRTNRALARSRRKIELTADIVRQDSIEFLAAVTASIDNLAYPSAGDASGADLARALYGDRKLSWIVEQANAHLSDYANFSKSSPRS